jgi:hypothetical protein
MLVDAVAGTVMLDNGVVTIEDNVLNLPLTVDTFDIGTIDGTAKGLNIYNTDGDGDDSIIITSLGAANFGDSAKFSFKSLHGDPLVPVAPTPGEFIGILNALAYEPTYGNYVPSCAIGFTVDSNETVTTATAKGKIFLFTNGGSATVPDQKATSVDSRGYMAVGYDATKVAEATLDVNGLAKLQVLDTAPASPVNGMIAIADGDSVSGWDPIGGAATGKQQMVVYLGGSWCQVAVEP